MNADQLAQLAEDFVNQLDADSTDPVTLSDLANWLEVDLHPIVFVGLAQYVRQLGVEITL